MVTSISIYQNPLYILQTPMWIAPSMHVNNKPETNKSAVFGRVFFVAVIQADTHIICIRSSKNFPKKNGLKNYMNSGLEYKGSLPFQRSIAGWSASCACNGEGACCIRN